MREKIDALYEKCNHIGEVAFWIGLWLELIIMMWGHSAFEIPYRGRITHLAFVLFGCKVLFTKYTKREWGVIFLLGIIGSLSYYATGDEWAIRIVMMVVSSKGICIQKVLRNTFWVSLAGTIMIIALSLLGIGGQAVDVRDYGRGAVEARWCLGFSHANNLHGTFWYIVSLGFATFFSKLRWWHGIVLTLANIGLYMLTISRTGLLVTELVIVAIILYKYYPTIAKWNWIYIMGGLATLFCAGIGIYVVLYGIDGNIILEKLSTMLTGRLELLTWWEKIEEWTLFGNSRNRKPTDIGFITIVSSYGYAILALYIGCLLIMIYYQCRNRKWIEFVLVISCVFYTFMESTYTINVYSLCNFTFLLLLGTWNHLLIKDKMDESI